MKRILIFSTAYAPYMAGAEIAVKEITDRLGGDYEFDLITCRFGSETGVEKIGSVNVYRVGFGSRLGKYLYPVLAYRLALKLHRKNPYQLVWAIMAAYAGAAGLFFKRKHPEVRLLLTLQEGDSIAHIHARVRGFKKQWSALFAKADYIQAISKFLADWAKEEDANCPVEVVPNGVDLSKFSVQGRLAWGGKVITVSRLVYKNGIDILIKAMASLPDCELEILGTGAEEKRLENLAKESKVDSRIHFRGQIERDELPEHLAQADIFVRPSRSEGLGISFLEPMAAGLPVVATSVGGIADFLIDGETGLEIRPEDPQDLAEKIKKLAGDENLRRKLAINGKKLVDERFDWNKIAQQMKTIFNKLS